MVLSKILLSVVTTLQSNRMCVCIGASIVGVFFRFSGKWLIEPVSFLSLKPSTPIYQNFSSLGLDVSEELGNKQTHLPPLALEDRYYLHAPLCCV